MVDAELLRLSKPGRSSKMIFPRLAKPPQRLDPGLIDGEGRPHPLSSRELLHCHAMSGAPPSTLLSSSGYFGGGNGGGGGESLALGIDIGIEDVGGENLELYELDLLEEERYRSEGFEA
jgi:hypothetical protein